MSANPKRRSERILYEMRHVRRKVEGDVQPNSDENLQALCKQRLQNPVAFQTLFKGVYKTLEFCCEDEDEQEEDWDELIETVLAANIPIDLTGQPYLVKIGTHRCALADCSSKDHISYVLPYDVGNARCHSCILDYPIVATYEYIPLLRKLYKRWLRQN